MVKVNACFGEILPAGMSRTAVRGFNASISRSKYLLKAIAAFLAVIIQTSIKTNNFQSNWKPVVFIAKKNPIIAKGSAKILCANSTNDIYFFMDYSIGASNCWLIASMFSNTCSQPNFVSDDVRK